MAEVRSTRKPVWEPPLDKSHLAIEKFRHYLNSSLALKLINYDDIHAFSIQHANQFWLALWDFLDIKCSEKPLQISECRLTYILHGVDEAILIDQFPKFFAGSRLNYAENVLRHTGSRIALTGFTEATSAEPTILSWDELGDEVSQFASAMSASNVKKNDVIAFIGANSATPVITFLATASLGAIFTSVAGDMGEKAVLDRLLQIRPKILFADSSYRYKGTVYSCTAKVSRVVQTLREKSGLESAVLLNTPPRNSRDLVSDQWLKIEDFVSRGNGESLRYTPVSFTHPMLVLFSSGTTGSPKAMVHSHGGTLINLKKEHVLHNNMSAADLCYHYTNIGWTMWNIFLGGLLAGASLLLYDGSPFYPSPQQHVKDVISLGATVFGGSPRYYTELRRNGVLPREIVDVSRVRLLHSTGAVLPAEIWSWMSDAFRNPAIMSFSGGTEICGSFVHGSLLHQQYAGEITVKALGIDVAVFDESGKHCLDGDTGDLVIKRPFPNSAVRFWNDDDFSKYRASYFTTFPGVWTQGDFVQINPLTKGIIITGRSDGVLNPSGVRFGSSEIYAVLSTLESKIEDYMVVGQRRAFDLDEQVLLFIQMAPGVRYDKDIQVEIKQQISQALSMRHVPRCIVPVARIPYNVNGKRLETLVKRVVSGGELDDRIRSTLICQDDLDFFKKFAKDEALEPYRLRREAKL